MVFQAFGISKSFGPTVALDGVGLSLASGEVHALVGENGSGKSTLMRILHGEIAPDAGTMSLDGEPFSPRSPRDAMDRGLALVHQELAVCGHMTIWENVFLGAERGVSISERISRTRELLERLGHGDLDPGLLVRSLAPAAKQIVEIARALRSEAKVILFDEPTSSLGRADVSLLFEVIRQLKEGRAIVYISHFLDEIAEIADRVTVLRDGVLAGSAAPGETDEIIRLMTGRSAEQVYHRSERAAGEPVLQVDRVSGRRVPREASLELRKGEVLGIAGLNGAGRTELVRCLFGLDGASGSVAREKVEDLARSSPFATPGRRWREGIGFVSEDRKVEGLALNLTLAENLTMPDPKGRRRIAGGSGLHPGRDGGNEDAVSGDSTHAGDEPTPPPRGMAPRTQAVIDRLRVKCQGPDQKISSLSGGNQQKIAIGRLLDMDSEILLLDEPTRGIDIGSKAEIFRLIDELANQGKSVILISSYLPELMGLCDRITVLRRGEVVATLDARQTDEHEVMQLCTGR